MAYTFPDGPGELSEFESIIARSAPDIRDRGPRLDLKAFNDFAGLLPFFASGIVKQDKILQKTEAILAVVVSGISKFF